MSHTTKPSLAPSHASASAVMQGQKADGPLGLRFDSHAQPQLFDDAVLQDPAIQHQQLRHDAAPAQRPYQQLQPQQQHASLPSAYVPQVPLSEQHQQSRPTESMGGQFFPLIPVDSATVPVPYAQSIPFGDKIETSAVAAAAAADAIATGQQYMLSFSTNEQADHWTGLAQSAHIPNPAFLPAGARASHALGPSSHPIEMPMPMVPTPTQRHVVSYSALNQPPLMVGPSVATLDGVAFSNGHNMVHSVSTGDGTPAAATAAVSGNRPGHGKGKVLSSVTVCTFCRLRKLRCDGEQPCRQCERRSLQCVHAPASGAGRRELAIGRGAASAAAAKEGPYSKPKANKEKSKTSDGNNEAKGAIAARTVGSPDGGMDLAVPSEHFRPLDLAPGASLVDLVRVGPSGGQHAFDETPIHTQPPAAQATALHIHDGHHSSPAAGRITSIPPMLQPRKGRATTSFTVSMASPHQSLPNTQGQPTRAWTSADHVQPLALSQSQSRSKITASPPPEHTFTRSAEADDGLCQVAASATSGYLWLSYEVDPALYDDGDDASVASSQEEDEDKAEEEEDDHDVGAAIPEEPLPSALTGNRSASALHLVRNHSLRRRLHAARATIAREPDNRSSRNPGWWDEVVLIFGPSRARSRRMIKSLTEHFTTSNAIFFGLIYPPELMALLQDADKRAKAHPALLPAVLAVAMMSIKEKRPEPFNIDFLSIDPVTRQIVAKLHKMAITQLQATIESGSNRSITMAQATTLLTLLSEDVQEKRDLINLIQQTILGNRWAAAVPGSAASADAAFYTRPPSAVLEGGTADADVLLETLLRLCWTPSSHWMRDMLLAPHEDNIKLPLHLEMVRPIGHWEPSQLPKELPLSFHCIQELLRLGSHLVRIACKAARISSHQQALVLSERLDALEDRLIFIRLKGLDEGGTQMRNQVMHFVCCALVPLRLSIWRKTGIWTKRTFENYILDFGNTSAASTRNDGQQQHPASSSATFIVPLATPSLHRTYIPPSLSIWLDGVIAMTSRLLSDAGASVEPEQTSAAAAAAGTTGNTAQSGRPAQHSAASHSGSSSNFAGGTIGDAPNAPRPPLKQSQVELQCAASNVKALMQLHAALNEGDALLSHAERLLAALSAQVSARKAMGMIFPSWLPDEVARLKMTVAWLHGVAHGAGSSGDGSSSSSIGLANDSSNIMVVGATLQNVHLDAALAQAQAQVQEARF